MIERGTKSVRHTATSIAQPKELFRPPLQGGLVCMHAFPGFRYASPWAILLPSLREVALRKLRTEETRQVLQTATSIAQPKELFRPPLQGGLACRHAFPGFRYASPWAILLPSLREVACRRFQTGVPCERFHAGDSVQGVPCELSQGRKHTMIERGTKSVRQTATSIAQPKELFRPPLQGGLVCMHAFPGFRYASPWAILLPSLREVPLRKLRTEETRQVLQTEGSMQTEVPDRGFRTGATYRRFRGGCLVTFSDRLLPTKSPDSVALSGGLADR
jgi:hypothetical protein